MAPELLMENVFSEKGDVYSYGIATWEILTCSRPFEGIPPMQVSTQVCIKRSRPPVPREAPRDLIALMQVSEFGRFGCFVFARVSTNSNSRNSRKI